jgi:hypothetical protein
MQQQRPRRARRIATAVIVVALGLTLVAPAAEASETAWPFVYGGESYGHVCNVDMHDAGGGYAEWGPSNSLTFRIACQGRTTTGTGDFDDLTSIGIKITARDGVNSTGFDDPLNGSSYTPNNTSVSTTVNSVDNGTGGAFRFRLTMNVSSQAFSGLSCTSGSYFSGSSAPRSGCNSFDWSKVDAQLAAGASVIFLTGAGLGYFDVRTMTGDDPAMPTTYAPGGGEENPPRPDCDVTNATGTDDMTGDPIDASGHYFRTDRTYTFSLTWTGGAAVLLLVMDAYDGPSVDHDFTDAESPFEYVWDPPDEGQYVVTWACQSDSLVWTDSGVFSGTQGSDPVVDLPGVGPGGLDDCIAEFDIEGPSGWFDAINPAFYINLAYESMTGVPPAIGCAATWVVVPSRPFDQYVEDLRVAADGSIVGAGIGIADGLGSSYGGFDDALGEGGCEGPTLAFGGATVSPMDVCSGGAQTMVTMVRAFASLAVVVGGALALVRLLMMLFHGPQLSNGTSDENGQGSMPL